jgi:hypothetical protein
MWLEFLNIIRKLALFRSHVCKRKVSYHSELSIYIHQPAWWCIQGIRCHMALNQFEHMITFYEYWYWNWANRLFFSSWKLWIMNMQPTVFWNVNRYGFILRFTRQVRPNHWHPTTHLLNYTTSFPRRSKSYLYQHYIFVSARYKHFKSQSLGVFKQNLVISKHRIV